MAEQGKELATVAGGSMAVSDTMVPRNLAEIKDLATFMAASDLIPKSLGGRKENVAMVLLLGHEIGVPGIAALSNIYVVNGRPSIWGDLATALVRRSPLCESLSAPVYTGEGAKLSVSVSGKRKGDPNVATFTYSMEDAKLAGLLGKDTWLKSPKDMLFWKAFHRLAKFLWPDVLKGIAIREIAEDFIEVEAEPVVTVEVPKALPAAEPERKPGRPAGSKNKPKPTPEPTPEPEPIQEPEPTKPTPPANPAAEAVAGIPPAEEGEMPVEPEPETPAEVVNKAVGTVLGCVKLTDPKTARFVGYAAKIATKDGEKRYLMADYDMAVEVSKLKGKTVELTTEKMAEEIASIAGKVVGFTPIKA